jgi:hypothetical protein
MTVALTIFSDDPGEHHNYGSDYSCHISRRDKENVYYVLLPSSGNIKPDWNWRTTQVVMKSRPQVKSLTQMKASSTWTGISVIYQTEVPNYMHLHLTYHLSRLPTPKILRKQIQLNVSIFCTMLFFFTTWGQRNLRTANTSTNCLKLT